jgi:hypothetical protein
LAFFLTNPTFAKSFGAKVALSAVPEFLATFVFVISGLMTKNMYEIHDEVLSKEEIDFRQPNYEWSSEIGHAM